MGFVTEMQCGKVNIFGLDCVHYHVTGILPCAYLECFNYIDTSESVNNLWATSKY